MKENRFFFFLDSKIAVQVLNCGIGKDDTTNFTRRGCEILRNDGSKTIHGKEGSNFAPSVYNTLLAFDQGPRTRGITQFSLRAS